MMAAGLAILVLGVLMMLFTWVSYKRADNSLSLIKQEDLVNYYLDLAIKLIPVPLWSGLIGIILTVIGIIVILINLPWSF